MSHSHTFKTWPFQLPVNTGVFTTRQVLDNSEPIREVYHEHDGDWQLVCGTTAEAADAKLVCLGCIVETDPAIGELANLPVGWRAIRDGHGSAWTREPFLEEDDED